MNNKNDIRKHIKNLFKKQDRDILEDKSNSIITQLLAYINTHNYKHIACYESMIDEVETIALIDTLEKEGKQVYTPQMISETEMIFIDKQFDIYEEDIDLFIIPGRAFSSDGKRLGRGKGYYDRFLAQKQYKKSKKIGICFDFQVLENIPTNKYDISMNKIITNTHD